MKVRVPPRTQNEPQVYTDQRLFHCKPLQPQSRAQLGQIVSVWDRIHGSELIHSQPISPLVRRCVRGCLS